MKRWLAIALGLTICAAVTVTAYGLMERALELTRTFVMGLDAPVSADTTPVVFRVEPGDTAADIAAALERRGLIRSARVFRLLVEREGVGHRLAAGEYELSPAMSAQEVIAILAAGQVRQGARITIPEGWRAEEIAWKLEALAPGVGAEYLNVVYGGELFAAELELPPGASLEGFLFPDTYEWRVEEGAEALVTRMVGEFLRHFDPERRELVARRGLSPREAVTLASIVEREAVRPEERPLIAGVYYNRLALGMPLQADPTVQYALAEPRVPAPAGVLWKYDLTLADLEVPSPYNTYRRPGLPAGPICNPGLASLDAVVRPAATDALYFVARGDGSHAFARTLDEHLANVRRLRASGP